MTQYDLIIIGSGPAGRSAAIQAGKLKRRVLLIDRDENSLPVQRAFQWQHRRGH